MTDSITVWCRLSLAEPITRMIPDRIYPMLPVVMCQLHVISWGCQIMKMLECTGCIEIILVMGSANDRQRYIVMSSLIGWAHNQNDPWLDQLDVKSWKCWNVQVVQRSFWLCAQPMTDSVTVWCRLSLAEPITRMIPDRIYPMLPVVMCQLHVISWGCQIMKMLECTGCIEIILVMGSANDRQRYIVMSSLIGWAHNQNDPWLDQLGMSNHENAGMYMLYRDHSGYGLSQWQTRLQCDVVSHWLRP